jgi:4a-hydroxytetrahydrobiopterin dehydratase
LFARCGICRRIVLWATAMKGERHCVPCTAGHRALRGSELAERMAQLGHGWRMVDEHHLEKEFTFRNFKEALLFTTRVGELAEAERHHPEIHLRWGKARVTLWTHKSNGVTENDFILAAKTDAVASGGLSRVRLVLAMTALIVRSTYSRSPVVDNDDRRRQERLVSPGEADEERDHRHNWGTNELPPQVPPEGTRHGAGRKGDRNLV